VQFVAGRGRLAHAGLPPVAGLSAPERRLLLRGLGVTALVLGGLGLGLASGALDIARLSDGFALVLLAVTAGFFITMFRASHWKPGERRRLQLIFILFVAAAVFWSLFEQAGSTLNLFAARNTQLELWGYAFPATFFQSVNPLLIIALAPVFAFGWLKLGARNPAPMTKFTLGLVLVAAGFGVLIVAAQLSANGVKVSPLWLVATYLLHSLGELCLSPVGLSAISRLAPARIASLTMGVWFLASAVGNYLGGRVAGLYERVSLPMLFTLVTGFALLAALVLWILRPYASRLLASSTEGNPA
jgi:POT family proton-dependent oligopeptide transporter